MRHYQDTVLRDGTGLAVQGASVAVRVKATPAGSGALATIYSDSAGSTAKTNPLTTDAEGKYDFFVADGSYDLVISYGTKTLTLPDIEIFDYDDRLSIAAADARFANKVQRVADRAELADLATNIVAYFDGSFWPFDSANLSAKVTADTAKALYVAPSSDITGASGARVRQYSGPLNIQWFGAPHTNSTDLVDSLPAFEALVKFLPNLKGAKVYCPGGKTVDDFYYFSDTLICNKPIIFEGDGADPTQGTTGTIIAVPAGVTAFNFTRGPIVQTLSGETVTGGGSEGAKVKDISFQALASSSTTTTATWSSAAGYTLNLAAAGDFRTGQIILMRGAGLVRNFNRSQYYTAATTAGSAIITFNREARLPPGTHISIAGAGFPAGTYVVSVDTETQLTLSANATTTVAAGAITYWEDRIALIEAGGGTTTLTINDGPTVGSSWAGVVEHYDCAIWAESKIGVEHVTAESFATGATLALQARSGKLNRWGSQPNCNDTSHIRVDGLVNRNVIRLQGSDANNISFINPVGNQNTEPVFYDAGSTGSSIFGGHAAGGYGYWVTNSNAATLLVGCYSEANSTFNVLGPSCLEVGGVHWQGNLTSGGAIYTGNDGTAYLPQARLYPSAAKIQATIGSHDLDKGVMHLDASDYGGSASYYFLRYDRDGAVWGQQGSWHAYDASTAKTAFFFTDILHARGAGHFYTLSLSIGDGVNTAESRFRKLRVDSAAPATGAFVAGDTYLNKAPAVGGVREFINTVGGSPGTWVASGIVGGVQAAAVADLTSTATTGTLPTADGSITIADAAAPTNAELLEYCRELEAKVEALMANLRTALLLAA